VSERHDLLDEAARALAASRWFDPARHDPAGECWEQAPCRFCHYDAAAVMAAVLVRLDADESDDEVIDLVEAEAPDALGGLVARTMAERHLTLQAVAARGGLSVAAVSAIRSGSRGRRPLPSTLDKLARGLDLDVAQLRAAAASRPPATPSRAERELLRVFGSLKRRHRRAVIEFATRQLVEQQRPANPAGDPHLPLTRPRTRRAPADDPVASTGPTRP
jgi:transcriptional regulator with XRE-family HTH domain